MESAGKKKEEVYILSACIGLMMIVALAFTFCKATNVSYSYYYGFRTSEFWDLGFHFIAFSSNVCGSGRYLWAVILIGIICWLMLIIGLCTLITSLICFYKGRDKKGTVTGLCIVSVVLICLYMIAGIVTCALTVTDSAYTLAFIPAIIVIGLFIPYMVIYKKERTYMPSEALNGQKDGTTSAHFEEQLAKAKEEGALIGAVYCIAGAVGKSLTVYENKCVIKTRTTLRSVVVGNFTDGEKTIYFADLTGVQFRRCSTMLLGYLQFETASTQSNRRNGNWAANYDSENSFTFEATVNDLMGEVTRFIKVQIEKIKDGKTNPIIQQSVSAADELAKYKKLLDVGVLTQDEFDAKKKELLNL